MKWWQACVSVVELVISDATKSEPLQITNQSMPPDPRIQFNAAYAAVSLSAFGQVYNHVYELIPSLIKRKNFSLLSLAV